jgi:NADH-quinone oxidoreductase subunit K
VDIGVNSYVAVATALFVVGLVGVMMVNRNILVTLMSIELLFLAASLNFTIFSYLFEEPSGQIFSLFILAIAAAGAALGLGIMLGYLQVTKIKDMHPDGRPSQ